MRMLNVPATWLIGILVAIALFVGGLHAQTTNNSNPESFPNYLGRPATPVICVDATGAPTGCVGGVENGYPSNSTPITASATGTTASVSASLAAASGKTTYICGWMISADATTPIVGSMTITGTITGTLTQRQSVGTAPLTITTSPTPYQPCIPASAPDTAIAVNSVAASTGGNTAVNVWGYQL